MSFRPLSLPVLNPGDELSGVAPARFERSARLCRVGDPTHRGLVFTAVTLARHGLSRCTAPSARGPIVDALDAAERWAKHPDDAHAVRKSRSEAFSASLAVQRSTVGAVSTSVTREGGRKRTPLDAHGWDVVLRYVGLGASHACGAVLLTLDGVDEPGELARVAQQVSGAIAYHRVGLGRARSPELREAAWSRAEWETARQLSAGHGVEALAVQLFHEFLGAAWKDQSDAERLYLFDFIEWALGPDRPG
jgi:hypothetical protein